MWKTVRKALKSPLMLVARTPFVRKRLAWHFRYDWFADLDVAIPLGGNFWCPLATADAVHSFGEIFVADEYGPFLEHLPLPRRWIDLGCHAGYFSLYLAWKHALAGSGGDWRALLLDADPRMEPLVRHTMDTNNVYSSCKFLSGLISRASGDQPFAIRDVMASSADTTGEGIVGVQKIPVISPAEILAAFPPPYDLIKLDIEGGEVDFLDCYKDVYTRAYAIVMEWHSPDREGSRARSLRATLEAAGFRHVCDLQSVRAIQRGPDWFSSGVQLYLRNSGG